MGEMKLTQARARIAIVWITLMVLLYMLVSTQTLTGEYGVYEDGLDNLLSGLNSVTRLTLPTASVLFASYRAQRPTEDDEIQNDLFWIAMGSIIIFYLMVFLCIVFQNQRGEIRIAQYLSMASFILTVPQFLVTASVAKFLIKSF